MAVAALFQPAGHRIQQTDDRRFNRRKYNAAKTIEAFSARLSDLVDLNTLSTERLVVVDRAIRPTTASLWLGRPSNTSSSDGVPLFDRFANLIPGQRRGVPRRPAQSSPELALG